MIAVPTYFVQGQPDCYSHPPATAFQCLLRNTGREVWVPSRRFLDWAVRQMTPMISLTWTLHAVKRFGVCPEKLWPYNPDKVSPQIFYRERPKPEALAEALKWRAASRRIASRKPEVIKALLDKGWPIMFVFTVVPAVLEVDIGKSGVYIAPKRGQKTLDHDATIMGADASGVTCLNSFGRQWGNDGTFLMPWADLASKRCFNFWVMDELLPPPKPVIPKGN